MKTHAFRRLQPLLCLLLTLAMLLGLITPAMALTPPTNEAVTDRFPDGFSQNESQYEIYPVPHSIAYPKSSAFTMTKTVNAVIETGIDQYTVKFLEDILTDYGMTMTKSAAPVEGKTNILLGIEGSGGVVDAAAKSIPLTVDGLFDFDRNDPDNPNADRLDAYLLTADTTTNPNGDIIILGRNTDCTYYGLATLQMMFTSFAGKRFLSVHIEDYSNVVYRGFIEGFYGVYEDPYPERESQIRSIRDVKGNIYVFAAKGDAYHGSKWATLYPDEELKQIEHLVQVGLETKVAYAWSVHIGQGSFFSGVSTDSKDDIVYQQKLAQLKAKFQQLYDVGVRNFHILNDDSNSGTNQQVINLLNDMNVWRKEKGCRPIIYCCKGYNVAWAGNGAELNALRALDPDIYLYWTGGDVNTTITQQNVTWPYEKSGHYPVTWLNYPCSEHAGSVPLLGSAMYYLKDANNLKNHKGIISNPVRNHSETTKIAFFQLLSWGWNRDDYNSYADTLWEDCFKYLQPEVYDSYLTIAKNISNAPKSGRIPAGDNGFPESEDIKAALTSVQAKITSGASLAGDQEVQTLIDELEKIIFSVDDFRARCENPTLISQLSPWLTSLRAVVQSAISGIQATIALQSGDLDSAWTGFSIASTSLADWYAAVPDERGGGSKRIQPFSKAVIDIVSAKLTPMLSPDGLQGDVSFYAVINGTTQSDSANSAKMFDGDSTTAAEFNNKQLEGDYYGIDLGSVKTVSSISILQGKDDADNNYYHNATLECSIDGNSWITLVAKVNSQKIEISDLDVAARYVRLRTFEPTYAGKPDYWTRVREFSVNTIDTNIPTVYTNVALPADTTVTVDGGVYTLPALSDVTLAKGEYVGFKLPQIMGIKDVALTGELPAGLSLQHSANGVVWTKGVPTEAVSMRYLRILNDSDEPVTAALPGISGTDSESRITGTFVSSNAGSLAAGAWANVFDGDPATFAQNNRNQAADQYFIFDLGATQLIYDIKLYSRETGDTMYYLDVSLGDTSDPAGTWTTVGTVDNDARIDPPYRVFSCDGGGMSARYLKLQITKAPPQNQWIAFNEIEINKAHQQETSMGAFSGTPLGKFENAVDGDISTFLTPGKVEIEDGYFQYLLSERNTFSSLNILQSPASICNAAVKVQTADGAWQTLGKLDKSACSFPTADLGPLLALRLDWAKGSSPAIAEILFSGATSGGSASGQAPLLLPNIYETKTAVAPFSVNYGTSFELAGLPSQAQVTLSGGETMTLPVSWTCPGYKANTPGDYMATGVFDLSEGIANPGCFQFSTVITVKRDISVPQEPITGNLALNKAVTVSGTETAGDIPANAVDGNLSNRWSAYPKMKERDDLNSANQIAGVEWIVVDLNKSADGNEIGGTNTIHKVTIQGFSNKAWPTKYDIMVSDNGSTFTKVESFAYDAADKSGFEQVNTLSQATTGRFIKIVFNEMNIYAKAANSVSVAELIIEGTKTFDDGGGEVGPSENLALNHPTYVSGKEVSSGLDPAQAVDGSTGTHWSTNGMKDTQNQPESEEQYPSWIVVDLGDDVANITAITAAFNALVWPTSYKVQIAETFSGGDFSTQNVFRTKATGTLIEGTLTGDNALDDAIWTTIATINRPSSGTRDPVDNIVFASEDLPASSRYIRLYFEKMNVNAAGHTIGLKELTVTGNRSIPEVPPADSTVKSVDAITAAGTVGTDFASLTLPERVVATLADDTRVSLPVTWDSTGYDANSTAPQSFTGTLSTSGTGITNPSSKTATLSLTLTETPKIISITVNPSAMPVELGTSFPDVALPTQVTGMLSNGLSKVCSVVWSDSGFNGAVSGQQVITGTVTPPVGTEIADDLTASITLNVRDTTAPTTPTAVTVTNVTATTVTLSWNPSIDAGGIAGYTVYHGDSSTNAGGTTATISGLTSGTDYIFRVTAKDHAGNSSFASTVTFTTDFTVKEHSDSVVVGAVVKLLQGGTVAASATTSADGGYHFTGTVDPGVYSLTVTYTVNGETATITSLVTLAPGERAERNITLPEYKVDTSVTLAPDLPPVAADISGIASSLVTPEEAAQGASLSLSVSAADQAADISAINAAAQGRKMALMLELDFTKTVGDVSTPITDTNGALLTVAVPLDPEHQGKENYVVYRCHGGKVDTITAAKDGERLEVFDTYLLLHLSKFSTYAIAYGDPVIPPSSGPSTYQLKATSTEGGTITPISTRVSRGDSKTFNITPEKGYRLVSLSLDGKAVDMADLNGPDNSGSYTYTLKNVKASHTLHAVFDVHHRWEDFADIGGHWAETAIRWAVDEKLMDGTGQSTFTPGGTSSRAMIVTVLWRMAGSPEVKGGAAFSDVPANSWYANAVAWAGENDLADGVGGGLFAPDRSVTRQELAVFLCRFAALNGTDTTAKPGALSAFPDADAVAPWAVDAMAWCVERQLINGRAGRLDGSATATRAELAILLQRLSAVK